MTYIGLQRVDRFLTPALVSALSPYQRQVGEQVISQSKIIRMNYVYPKGSGRDHQHDPVGIVYVVHRTSDHACIEGEAVAVRAEGGICIGQVLIITQV